MKKLMPYALAALVGVGAVIPAQAATNPQKPGKWRTTIQMEMPNMPVKMPPFTFETCVTEEDLKDPQKSIPNDPKNPCKISDYEIDGNTVTWTMECPKTKTKGVGELTFTDSSFDGEVKITMGEQQVTSKYSGKYLGACEK